MPRAMATYEAVAKAAEVCLAAGQEPTLLLIQEKIGGSFSTIKRHLDQWLAAREATSTIHVPEVILNQGQQLMREVWRTAEAQAQQQVARVQQEATQAQAAAEQRMANTLQAIERLEQAQEEQQHTITTLQQTIEQQQQALAEAMTQAAVAQAQQQSAEQRVAELQQEVAQLRSELTTSVQLRGEIAALQRQVQEQQEKIIAQLGSTTHRQQR